MFKKTRILILAVMTATVMLLGSTAAFAADGDGSTTATTSGNTIPTADQVSTVTINKNVKSAANVTAPATEFTYSITQTENEDGVTSPITNIGTITATITTEAKAGDGTNFNKAGSTTIQNAVVAKTTKPGEYTFTVTEDAVPTDWENSTEVSYKLHVLVQSNKDATTGKYIVEYYIEKITTDATSGSTTSEKAKTMEFNNTYTKTVTVTVGKNITNPDYANIEEDTFTVNVTFTKVAPNTGDTFTATVGETEKTITYGTPIELTLKHNETIDIVGVPAGTTYVAVDADTGNYTYTNTDYVTNDTKTEAGAAGGDGVNSATVNNTFKTITVTGIVTTYLPYIAMILLAIAALALYVVSKRRRAARY